MIIEDTQGNVLTELPNLQKGRLSKCVRTLEDKTEQVVYVYFPFDEDEQTAYEVNNNPQITTDKCQCLIYESTKATVTYAETLPFSNAYARRVQIGEIELTDCPSELQDEIKNIVEPSGDITIALTGDNVTYYEDPESEPTTSITKTQGTTLNINVAFNEEEYVVDKIEDSDGNTYTRDEDGNIIVTFDKNKTITTTLAVIK